jgi:hypothetical protein
MPKAFMTPPSSDHVELVDNHPATTTSVFIVEMGDKIPTPENGDPANSRLPPPQQPLMLT